MTIQKTGYPLVSVIIPVFNREQYIVQAMNSILLEDYPQKEIILIDDGSTDTTKAVIEQWIAAHQHLVSITFKSRANRGFIKTLNELIQLSHGDYIVFFGSDDYLKNNGIFKRYEYLQTHPDKLMVVGDCYLVDGNDHFIHESAYEYIGKVDKRMLLTDKGMQTFMILNGYVPGATLMARKQAYHEFGLYDENLHAEDWVYYIRVVAKNKLGFLNEVVSAYRYHDNNMCFSAMQITQAKEQLFILCTVFYQFPSSQWMNLLKRFIFSLIYIPYLTMKFSLLDDTARKQSSSRNTAKVILSFLLKLKKAFIAFTGPIFARMV